MKKRIFVLVAVTVHTVGFAQSDLDAFAERQRALAAQIEAEQSRNGPLSADLINPLTSLALLYEEDGNIAVSLAVTERVLQIIRINFGIYSIEQAPMLRRLMRIAEANGDSLAAWNYEQELLELARRNPGNLRTVRILRDVGDNRVDLLDRYIAGEYPPEIEFGCYLAGEAIYSFRGCSAGSLERAARTILAEAHETYLSAIEILLEREQYESQELRELEWDIVESGMEHGRYLGGSAGCHRVDERLTRLHEYDVLSEAPLQQRVDSLLRTADWKLYCNWNAVAHKAYEAVLDLLAEEGASQADIDRLFSPDVPILLPGFADSPLVTREPHTSAAYVDVAFEVTRFGTTRSIDVIEGKKRPGADDVVRVIRRRRFRPYAVDGVLVDSPRVVVRYFLGE